MPSKKGKEFASKLKTASRFGKHEQAGLAAEAAPASSRSAALIQPVPWLARLPPELLDEILSYLRVMPLTFYYDVSPTHAAYPPLTYRERFDALRALAQTSRALREVALPLQWARFEAAWVPEARQGTWYKYVTMELERKANGMQAHPDLVPLVQYLTFTVAKTKELTAALSAFATVLPLFTNLHTLHIVAVGKANALRNALPKSLSLPKVRTAVVPSNAHWLVRACPNVQHVRCVGGSGKELVSALKGLEHVRYFSGYVDWDDKLAHQLVKNAPKLQHLEFRRRVCWGLGILSQCYAPPEWKQAISHLSGLHLLHTLDLVFPGTAEQPDEAQITAAARVVISASSAPLGRRRLIVRHVQAPHSTNELQEEIQHKCMTEFC